MMVLIIILVVFACIELAAAFQSKRHQLGYYSIVMHRKCIAKQMINPRISAVWSTTKAIAPFLCTPRVQDVHTKAEVVHLTPGLLGLGLLFNW